MLMQNFMFAADLGITEPQKDALIKTLALMETNKLTHAPIGNGFFFGSDGFTGHFNMLHWNSKVDNCGTVACIGGTAELVGGVSFAREMNSNPLLYALFMPHLPDTKWNAITPAQAARALRSYLTTGHAKWSEAVA